MPLMGYEQKFLLLIATAVYGKSYTTATAAATVRLCLWDDYFHDSWTHRRKQIVDKSRDDFSEDNSFSSDHSLFGLGYDRSVMVIK